MVRDKVEEALNSVRESLQAHGGDVELVGVDEEQGTVQVRLTGACVGCPMSQMTLRTGIERALKQLVPEVKAVVEAPPLDVARGGPAEAGRGDPEPVEGPPSEAQD